MRSLRLGIAVVLVGVGSACSALGGEEDEERHPERHERAELVDEEPDDDECERGDAECNLRGAAVDLQAVAQVASCNARLSRCVVGGRYAPRSAIESRPCRRR